MVPKLSRDTKPESNHHDLHLLGVFLAALQQRRASCSGKRWVAGGRGFRGQQCVKENLGGKKSTVKKIQRPLWGEKFQFGGIPQFPNPFISGVTVAGYPAFPKRAPKRAECSEQFCCEWHMSFFPPRLVASLGEESVKNPLKGGYINIPVIVPVRR